MTETASSGLSTTVPEKATSRGRLGSAVLHVCTSCRPPGSPRTSRESRPGFKLYQELRERVRESAVGHCVQVKPAECLSICPRPCGIALSSPGAWSYLFGDQRLSESAADIVACATQYIDTADGFMPREQRPKSLRTSILGRVPPFDGGR